MCGCSMRRRNVQWSLYCAFESSKSCASDRDGDVERRHAGFGVFNRYHLRANRRLNCTSSFHSRGEGRALRSFSATVTGTTNTGVSMESLWRRLLGHRLRNDPTPRANSWHPRAFPIPPRITIKATSQADSTRFATADCDHSSQQRLQDDRTVRVPLLWF